VLALEPADLAPVRAAEWPHPFSLRLRVQAGGARLTMTLEVDNTGAAPFDFSAALHTYHKVAHIDDVVIDGVQAAPLTVGESLDAIYTGVGDVVLHDGQRRLHSSQQGFSDAVVWNPGRQASASMADTAPGEYRHFVCIEPAVIAPVTLAPGQAWRGTNTLSSIP
jgi:glucose-6-phosphate 1-epimerase